MTGGDKIPAEQQPDYEKAETDLLKRRLNGLIKNGS